MAATRNRLLGLLLLLLLLSGCTKPDSSYGFVSTETARRSDGRFEFRATFDDSTLVYQTALAARLVASRIPDGAIGLDIRMTAPDGAVNIERIEMPLQGAPGAKLRLGSGSVVDCEWPHRQLQVSGPQAGTWKISIAPTRPELLDALYGIGFSYKGTTWEKAN